MSNRWPRLGLGRFGGWLGVACLGYGCAQISQPTGGTKDNAPPVPLAVVPASGTLHWEPGTLLMVWDEYIEVKDARNQWLISPPVASLPTYTIRGKTITWDWSDCGMEPNRTYQFQLGRSVVDFHEGNPVDGLRWVVSTGAALDSGRVPVRVLAAESRLPLPGVRVMLAPWSLSPDSLLSGHRPSYVAVTDANGEAVLDHLAAGAYRLFAVGDANGDYRWQAGETLGLWPDSVTPGWDSLAPVLQLVQAPTQEAPGRFRWSSAVVEPPGWIRAAGVGTPPGEVQLFRGTAPLATEVEVVGDSVWVVPLTPGPLDSLRLVAAGDTIRCRSKRAGAASAMPVPVPVMGGGPAGQTPATPYRTLRFDAPIQSVDAAAWSLLRDGVAMALPGAPTCRGAAIEVPTAETPGARWQLQALPGAWQGIDGRANPDTVRWEWETQRSSEFAVLQVRLGGMRAPGWLALLDAQDRVLDEVPLAPTGDPVSHVWGNLVPGTVNLRWREDTNENGTFDGPDFANWRLPERVLRTGKGLTLLPNWEMEWVWDLEGPAATAP